MSAGVPLPVKSTSLSRETVSCVSSLTSSVPCTKARRRPLPRVADLLD